MASTAANVSMRISLRFALLVSLLALTGCSSAPMPERVAPVASGATSGPQSALENGAVVDEIRLGIATDCAGSDCDTRLRLATAEVISKRGLAPSAIGPAEFYLPYVAPGATLGSGGGLILVFDVDEGSPAAVYTFCFTTCEIVDPQPASPMTLPSGVDHGPMVDPQVAAPVDCSSPDHPTCNEALRVAIATATEGGFIAPATVEEMHYYISYITPGSPESAVWDVEYIVNLYVPGEHDNLAEQVVGVTCGSGSCHSVPPPD
jgi:hypothetical protein